MDTRKTSTDSMNSPHLLHYHHALQRLHLYVWITVYRVLKSKVLIKLSAASTSVTGYFFIRCSIVLFICMLKALLWGAKRGSINATISLLHHLQRLLRLRLRQPPAVAIVRHSRKRLSIEPIKKVTAKSSQLKIETSAHELQWKRDRIWRNTSIGPSTQIRISIHAC